MFSCFPCIATKVPIFPDTSKPPSSTDIFMTIVGSDESGGCKNQFSSHEKASEFLLSMEEKILAVTRLIIRNKWEYREEGWLTYSESKIFEKITYKYEYTSEGPENPLSPLLASSIIHEAKFEPETTIFDRAVRKANVIMTGRKDS